MIWSVVSKGFKALRRDRGAMVLSFILPVAFFTIFAAVFGGMGANGTPRVKVAVVDLDHSTVSQRLVRALRREASLDARTAPVVKSDKPAPAPYTAVTAESAVKAGDLPAAVLIPKGFGANPVAFGVSKNRPVLTILHDKSDPVAAQMVSGLLQKAVMMSLPDVMAQQGGKYMDSAVGGLTPDQKARFDANMQQYRAHLKEQEKSPAKGSASDNGGGAGLVAVSVRDVVGERHNSMISFYAAGIGVMFLLFTASGAAGSLIDESESGALDRMLSAGVSMTSLLAGKTLYCTLLAFLQLCVMFVWGALVFRLELWSHIPGFVVMTAATAFAVASFGMLLASLSHTRQQQGALSTLLVLAMSALGGSMFPRFLMPEVLQKVGLFTFNAWAIDGFTKVFWRDEPVWHLLPQVGVLIGAGIVLFFLSRVFARRWEYT